MNFVFRDTVIGIGVEEEDRKHTWMEDANSVSTKSNQHILYHNFFRWRRANLVVSRFKSGRRQSIFSLSQEIECPQNWGCTFTDQQSF